MKDAGREPRRGSPRPTGRLAPAFIMTLLISLVGHAVAHPSVSFAGSSPLSGSSPSCGRSAPTALFMGCPRLTLLDGLELQAQPASGIPIGSGFT